MDTMLGGKEPMVKQIINDVSPTFDYNEASLQELWDQVGGEGSGDAVRGRGKREEVGKRVAVRTVQGRGTQVVDVFGGSGAA